MKASEAKELSEKNVYNLSYTLSIIKDDKSEIIITW
jgi:hypothetical protein